MNKKRLRIAILLPGVGIIHRGTETFALALANKLREDHDVTILCMSPTNELYQQVPAIARDNALANRIYRSPIGRRLQEYLFITPIEFESLTFSICAFPHLFTHPYDFVLVANGLWGAALMRLIHWLRRVPFAVRGGGGIARPDFWIARLKPYAYIALVKQWQKMLLARVPSARVRVIHQAIDANQYHPQAPPQATELERPLFLCVGAAIPYKNIRLTIDAVAKLPKGGLLVLGDGPLRAELSAYGLEKLGPQRFQMMSVPHQAMPGYYSACDVFTLGSEANCEGFANVYLEAMACDKPVVATDDEGRREVIGGAGYYCDPHDSAAYAQSLWQAATTPPAENPRERALLFDWDQIANQYRQLIQECLKQRS